METTPGGAVLYTMLPRLFSTVTAARLTTIQYLPLQDLLHTPHLHLRTYVLSSIPTGPLSLRNLTEYIKVDPGCRSYYRWRLEMDNAAKTRKSHFVKPQDVSTPQEAVFQEERQAK